MEAVPFIFRGRKYSAKKRFFEGTHRLLSPKETYEKIRPFQKKIGLTRNANITGLDHLGIPVTLAIRPNSKTLSVSSGKGLTLEAALVSGIMESIELYHAETVSLPWFLLPYDALQGQWNTVPLELLPYRKNTLFHPKWPERWVVGWDLIRQEEVAVPECSVLMNYESSLGDTVHIHSFVCDSNGLASGNHFLEALAGALYEVIERDAISCHNLQSEQQSRIRPESIPFPRVQEMVRALEEKKVRCFLHNCTTDTQVYVYRVILFDTHYPYLGLISGYGAHLDPEVALFRALTEAVQGHTIMISGSRDDIFSSERAPFQQRDLGPDLLHYDTEPTVDLSKVASQAMPSFEEDVHLILKFLKEAGIRQVIAFDLTEPEFEISVVRVVVPGLEGYPSPMASPRKRAKEICKKGFLFHQAAGRG